VDAALDAAGIGAAAIHSLAAGMTGIDWPHEAPLLQGALSRRLNVPPERIQAVNDAVIALRAGTSSPSGCVLCAGSGLNCAVRRDAEHEYVFGFYVNENCQGGSALAERAIQAVLDAQAGLTGPTLLTGLLLDFFGFKTVDDLLMAKVTTGLGARRKLTVPKLLEQAAALNDPAALDVLGGFGRDIARYAVAGLKRMDMLHGPVEVVLSGSVFKCRLPVLQESVAAEIHRHAAQARIVDSVYEPVIGAVLMALDVLGGTDSGEIDEHIKRDASRFDMIRKNGEGANEP
jgi:N-acetylglucosamine kinase-like BadF-type ATPase